MRLVTDEMVEKAMQAARKAPAAAWDEIAIRAALEAVADEIMDRCEEEAIAGAGAEKFGRHQNCSAVSRPKT